MASPSTGGRGVKSDARKFVEELIRGGQDRETAAKDRL